MPTTDIFLDGPDTEDGIYYPSSDGKPIAETDFHLFAIRLLLDALDDVFEHRDDVYVAGNLNWFWKKGQPKARRAPDAMVVFGVERGHRRSFRSWKEGGAVPAVCFEMASRRTWKANLTEVKRDYEKNGVNEYFIFDPTSEYLPAQLIGFRRRGSRFLRIRPDSVGGMISKELGVCLVPENLMLRLVYPETGELVLTRQEQARTARAKNSASIAKADILEAEISAANARSAALEAELERVKAQLKSSGKTTNGSK